jgi:hypothetical protein
MRIRCTGAVAAGSGRRVGAPCAIDTEGDRLRMKAYPLNRPSQTTRMVEGAGDDAADNP